MDLGGGGDQPPLGLFYLFGYKTHGIDISDRELEKAREFCKKYDIDLHIKKGDMKKLTFDDQSISFIYSVNSMIFLTKQETKQTMMEIERVLKKYGLCFVNFLSIDDENFGQRKKIGENEYKKDGFYWTDEEVVESFFEDNEADYLFQNFEILRKEKRIVQRKCDNCQNYHRQAFIEYIAKKKK